MKKGEKINKKNNFTKLTHKRGISLIVLIVTIIVIIILAAVVILTITKNNPISSAKESIFKEDITSMQDELSMYLSKKYTENPVDFDKTKVNLNGEEMVNVLASTKKYKGKVSVVKGKLVWNAETKDNIEYKWFSEITDGATVRSESVKDEWKKSIKEVIDEDVPIPKGFEYLTGTKDTGVVIQDEKGNEFVWIPATLDTYVKDNNFPALQGFTSNKLYERALPNDIVENKDVEKYGGFYIGRYEAGVPDNQTTIDGKSSSTSNVEGTPVSKKGAIVWTCINYTNAKKNAENMIVNDYVQTGLLTGKAWDTTCNWIKNSVTSITDSRTYGNYFPNKKQTAGYSEKWMVRNIYDLAGNVYEWTNEASKDAGNTVRIVRGGSYANQNPVSHRYIGYENDNYLNATYGFRVRLYIK